MVEMKVPPVPDADVRSRFVSVDGVRTHYLEAGEGMPVVLLHSGEFGGCGALTWEYMIPELSKHFRVIAPDWLGYGQTAKVHDFDSKRLRMMSHMTRFVETLELDSAHFVANSMGATFLLDFAAQEHCTLPINKLVAISGGGFIPDNEHRRSLLDYDCTVEAMARIMEAIFENPAWYRDMAYIERRHALSILPGAWEAIAAARFKRPGSPVRSEFGHADPIAYEVIKFPSLIIAGACDKVRMPGFTDEFVGRIPDARAVVLPGVGHCPNLEAADETSKLVIEFLKA